MKLKDKVYEVEDWFDNEFKIPTVESRGEIYLASGATRVLNKMTEVLLRGDTHYAREHDTLIVWGKRGRRVLEYQVPTKQTTLSALDFIHKAIKAIDEDESRDVRELVEEYGFKKVRSGKGFNYELDAEDRVYHHNLDWTGYYFKDPDKESVVECYHTDYKPTYLEVRKALIKMNIIDV